MKTELTCILCPNSCNLIIEHDDKDIISISGNMCDRGITYATEEIKNPMRMVTSTVSVLGSDNKRLPVILTKEIPKSMIFEVMKEIKKTKTTAPINQGDILISNILNTGSDLVASRSISSNR
ncbi:MAG TPA: DUF1667 domain-containing protein [Anaerovoracaceae bacterium]|nr:DUF1667 domain-containing protein [Anaerovoracaceae bacterium]